MSKAKRKSDSSDPQVLKWTPQLCVLHVIGVRDHGPFTPFSAIKAEPKEKLKQLQQISDQRLAEPNNSVHRMQEVCALIPETLEGLDLKCTGYHRHCYQRFTSHLDRLKQPTDSFDDKASTKHHSPRKLHDTDDKFSPKFPQECFFL